MEEEIGVSNAPLIVGNIPSVLKLFKRSRRF